MGDEDSEVEHYDADIIILSFERLNDTLGAIESALSQKDVSTRIAVLDQGSSAQTLFALRERVRECRTLRLFDVTQNIGVGAGRNFLSSIGNGRIIVGLDNDAVFSDTHVVYNAVKLFDSETKLAVVGFKILTGDGRQIEDSSWGYPVCLKRRSDERFLTTTFVGAGHAIRRKTWDEVGQYDEALFFSWEEYDFCLRAIAYEWDIIYDGSLRVHHKVAAEQRVRWSQDRQRLFVRNRLIIARKWCASWLSLLPRITAYIINGALSGNLGVTLSGIYEAISIDKNILKRRMTPRMRNYMWLNEHRYRGSFFFRLRNEILKQRPGNS